MISIKSLRSQFFFFLLSLSRVGFYCVCVCPASISLSYLKNKIGEKTTEQDLWASYFSYKGVAMPERPSSGGQFFGISCLNFDPPVFEEETEANGVYKQGRKCGSKLEVVSAIKQTSPKKKKKRSFRRRRLSVFLLLRRGVGGRDRTMLVGCGDGGGIASGGSRRWDINIYSPIGLALIVLVRKE